MIYSYTRNWWLMVLRGVAAILFGLLALVIPGTAALALVLVFGAYAFVDGILTILSAVRHWDENASHWWLLVEGLAGIVAGLFVYFSPGVAVTALLFIVAFWALLTGIMEIVAAVRLRRELSNEWVLALTGILSIVLALFLIANPAAGLVGLVWAIGAYAIIFGGLMVILGIRMRTASPRIMV